jgi:GNAT superfamily N-acetyltransferase
VDTCRWRVGRIFRRQLAAGRAQSGPHLYLQHLYLLPGEQGRGTGAAVLRSLFDEADAAGVVVRVGVLRGSDANRFYQCHGFRLCGEEEWDMHYVRYPTRAGGQVEPAPWIKP